MPHNTKNMFFNLQTLDENLNKRSDELTIALHQPKDDTQIHVTVAKSDL